MRLPEDEPLRTARGLLASATRATLATRRGDGWPHASLVLAAVDDSLAPLLLLSEMAEHTRNLRADPRAALLFDGTAGLAEPLTGPRLTVMGELRPTADARLKERYLDRHPGARAYADFADFALWRMAPVGAHLVAGFGRIHRLDAADIVPVD